MYEYTLAIIKPDAMQRSLAGKIISKLEDNNFQILAFKMLKLTEEEAKRFYFVHREKSFYNSLCKYMSSSVIIAMLLKRENAIEELRKLMGATNPMEADPNTIRREYGINIEQNSIHGSDSLESARYEIPFFFSMQELIKLGIEEDDLFYAIYR